MANANKPAYLVACCSIQGEVDPKHGELAGPVAAKAGLEPLGGGTINNGIELLEGALPADAAYVVVERFSSMQALKEFYYSAEYQQAIPFREAAMTMHFMAAIEGFDPQVTGATD